MNRREMEGIDAETGHTIFFNFKVSDEDRKRGKMPVFTYEDYSALQTLMVLDKKPEAEGAREKKPVKLDGRALDVCSDEGRMMLK